MNALKNRVMTVFRCPIFQFVDVIMLHIQTRKQQNASESQDTETENVTSSFLTSFIARC